jgi:hypothetical protein
MESSYPPLSDESQSRPRRAKRRTSWQVLVESEIERLATQINTLGDASTSPWAAAAGRHIELARDAIAPCGRFRALRNWYTGAAIEAAWTSLHAAGEALLRIVPPTELIAEFPSIEAAFDANLRPDDPQRVTLEPAFAEAQNVLIETQRMDLVTETLRRKLVAIMHAAHVASDTAYEKVRRWRNVLLIAGTAVAILAVVLAVVHELNSDFLSLAPVVGSSPNGSVAEPWQVELVGIVGGAITAVLALGRFSGFTDPSGLPTVQALVRIPMSAITGLFGVLFMQTSTLEALRPQTGATTVLAYAFVFGYAQEPLLRMIDRQAGNVLDPAHAKDEQPKKPRRQRQPVTEPTTPPPPAQQ